MSDTLPVAAPPKWKPEVGGTAWVYARHYWREARVVEMGGRAGTAVVVAYRLTVSGRIARQKLRIWNLKPERPTTMRVVKTLRIPVPSLEQIEAQQ